MASRGEDFGPGLTLADGGLWPSPGAAPASEPRDWRSVYEQAQTRADAERARADAAEARCEELLQAERAARSRAGLLKTQLDKGRDKLKSAIEEVQEVRRAAKDALFFQSEVARLENLLSEAGVDSRKRSTIMSLRREVFQLRKALQVVQARKDTTAPASAVKVKPPRAAPAPKPGKDAAGALRQAVASMTRELRRLTRENARLSKALERSQEHKDELVALRRKVEALRRRLKRAAQASPPRASAQLRKALERTRQQKETIKALSGEVGSLGRETRRLTREARRLRHEQEQLQDLKATVRRLTFETRLQRGELAGYHDQMDIIAGLRRRVANLEIARRQSPVKEGLEGEFDGRPLVSALLGRVRDRDKTIEALRKSEERLGKKIGALRARSAWLEARIAQLCSTRAVLSKALFGSRSEQQEKPRSERRRGQQRGAAGHGRTQRPTLEEKTEVHNPPADACVCSSCGKPYVANGVHSSTVIEIEVQAHKRRIVRPRHRRGCDCTASPLEVTAPAPRRLFARTPYGTSVWARVLFERYACLRPLHRVAAWMADQGLPISAGTLASSVPRFLPLFEPLAAAILAHQNRAAVRHGDETAWRIQELRESGRSSRAWLWTSVSQDAVYFHIDPSRSAQVAHKLFGGATGTLFLVCDRYSAYRKMAREAAGTVILCWCWAHQRRDFIHCAAGHASLTRWCEGWIERIASIYCLNEARLKHYHPALKRQPQPFAAAQRTLEDEFHRLFAHAEQELHDLPPGARQARPLRSLLRHRQGLSVFIRHPQVPMDNNTGERTLRGPVIGRRLSFGSDSETGARFTAVMYSLVGTLATNGIDVRRWLEAWLRACASIGRRPPHNLSPWLPWSMSPELRRALMAPR